MKGFSGDIIGRALELVRKGFEQHALSRLQGDPCDLLSLQKALPLDTVWKLKPASKA